MAIGPRSAVFTTVLWNGKTSIADFAQHLKRLKSHAERLRIELPSDFTTTLSNHIKLIGASPIEELQLLNITYDSENDEIRLNPRPLPKLRNCDMHAISMPLKKWLGDITGTKHGDWKPYYEAKSIAEQNGADIALLIDEYCIIDGDRASVMVIDEDGVAYFSDSPQAVEGITLDVVAPQLKAIGIPVNYAKLNERLVARCAELIAVGVGIGACNILTIDGEKVGQHQRTISSKLLAYLAQHYSNINNWTNLCED
tara:strand:- start:3831 stop:4595 length:765 start_codon:yes stop_codon:yes gene_type:complete